MRSKFRGRRGTKLPIHLRLPERIEGEEPWTRQAVSWWQEVATSPQSTVYTEADRHGLYLAFSLIDEFYRELATPAATRGRVGRLTMLAVEIRQQIARYGLTPRDRLSLHWAIEDDEDETTPTGNGPKGNVTKVDFRSGLGA